MEPLNATVHCTPDSCEIWTGTQVMARVQSEAAKAAGLPVEKVIVYNHLLGGGFGRKLEPDMVVAAVRIAKQVDGPVKVVWTREEDIQHDVYRPVYRDTISASLVRRQDRRLEIQDRGCGDHGALAAAGVPEGHRHRRRR